MPKHKELTPKDIEDILFYVPRKPGYVWDCGWHEIPGYEEVTLHHIAAFADDVWGERKSRFGHEAPCPQDRRNKPKGKWRKRKFRRIYGEPYWVMRYTHETGHVYSTREHSSKGEKDGYE